jgi:hypothetical protein
MGIGSRGAPTSGTDTKIFLSNSEENPTRMLECKNRAHREYLLVRRAGRWLRNKFVRIVARFDPDTADQVTYFLVSCVADAHSVPYSDGLGFLAGRAVRKIVRWAVAADQADRP